MPESFETSVKLRLTVPAGEVDRIKKIVDAAVNPSTIKRIQAVPSFMGITGTNASTGVMGSLGGIVGKLGVIAAIANQALEFLGKIVGFLAQSSPALRGVLYQMEKAMMIFFRPFGDFLASLLRPLARSWLKMSREWLSWTKLNPEEKIASIIDPMKERVQTIFSGLTLSNFVEKLGSIWDVIDNTTRPIWYWIEDTFKPIWDYVSDVFHSIWEWIFSPLTNSKSIWDWILTPAKNIWELLTGGGGGGGSPNVGGGTTSTTTTGPSGASWTITNGTVSNVAGTVTKADIALAVAQGVAANAYISSAATQAAQNYLQTGKTQNPFNPSQWYGDFIWRSGSKPVQISPEDTIVGTKSGTTKSISVGGINIRIDKVSSDVDIERLASQVKDKVINSLRTMT